MDELNDLADLSTREMQVLGALCLQRFCKAKSIQDPAIHQLIEHLVTILKTHPLDAWERKGAALSLSGRGDPLPGSLRDRLPDRIRGDFKRLVDFVVEIGIGDMYAANTKKPLLNLARSLAILDDNEIQRPTVAELFKNRSPRGEVTPDWGEIYSPEEYDKVKAAFRA